jgi:cytochrome c biogenesis protein CcdA
LTNKDAIDGAPNLLYGLQKMVTTQRNFCAVIVVSLLVTDNVFGANEAPKNANEAFGRFSFLSSREFFIALAIILFGLAMAGFCVLLARTKTANADQITRIAALLLIVTGTLLLVATGYDAQQISPALGLLGAIAGYLLGKTDSDNNNEK